MGAAPEASWSLRRSEIVIKRLTALTAVAALGISSVAEAKIPKRVVRAQRAENNRQCAVRAIGLANLCQQQAFTITHRGRSPIYKSRGTLTIAVRVGAIMLPPVNFKVCGYKSTYNDQLRTFVSYNLIGCDA